MNKVTFCLNLGNEASIQGIEALTAQILKDADIVLVVGPPSSGKGTMLKGLGVKEQSFSTGDYFREQAKKNEATKSTINSGKLMPDEETGDIVAREIAKIAGIPYVDGWPRNVGQGKDAVKRFGKKIVVLYRNTERAVCERRSLGRVVCEECGETYSAKDNLPACIKPVSEGKQCGGKLGEREDEAEMPRRLDTFYNLTALVIPFFIEEGVLVVEIDGNAEIEELLPELREKLKPLLDRSAN